MATQITILRTSLHGAHLITDGNMVCWIQGRFLREDMTLTRMGLECLAAASQTYEDWKYQQKHAEEIKAAEKQAWLDARAAERQLTKVSIRVETLTGETEKALQIWAGDYKRMYGKCVRSFEYLPKSQVKVVSKNSEEVLLEMPLWIRNQNTYLFGRIAVSA